MVAALLHRVLVLLVATAMLLVQVVSLMLVVGLRSLLGFLCFVVVFQDRAVPVSGSLVVLVVAVLLHPLLVVPVAIGKLPLPVVLLLLVLACTRSVLCSVRFVVSIPDRAMLALVSLLDLVLLVSSVVVVLAFF